MCMLPPIVGCFVLFGSGIAYSNTVKKLSRRESANYNNIERVEAIVPSWRERANYGNIQRVKAKIAALEKKRGLTIQGLFGVKPSELHEQKIDDAIIKAKAKLEELERKKSMLRKERDRRDNPFMYPYIRLQAGRNHKEIYP